MKLKVFNGYFPSDTMRFSGTYGQRGKEMYIDILILILYRYTYNLKKARELATI